MMLAAAEELAATVGVWRACTVGGFPARRCIGAAGPDLPGSPGRVHPRPGRSTPPNAGRSSTCCTRSGSATSRRLR